MKTSPAYAPYGFTVGMLQHLSLHFNGEVLDGWIGGYHLGNGKRVYWPRLMRFTSPDDLSPFMAGGINPYAYCKGDPVNLRDPSGQAPSGKVPTLFSQARTALIKQGVITFDDVTIPNGPPGLRLAEPGVLTLGEAHRPGRMYYDRLRERRITPDQFLADHPSTKKLVKYYSRQQALREIVLGRTPPSLALLSKHRAIVNRASLAIEKAKTKPGVTGIDNGGDVLNLLLKARSDFGLSAQDMSKILRWGFREYVDWGYKCLSMIPFMPD